MLARPFSEEMTESAYHNAQQAFLSGLQASDGWYTMEGGLKWRYLEYRDTGDSPEPSDTVTVHYAGTFIDGERFDSSYRRGSGPIPGGATLVFKVGLLGIEGR